MLFQRGRGYSRNDEKPRLPWLRKLCQSNVLIYLVLSSSVVNVLQALLIGLSSPRVNQHLGQWACQIKFRSTPS
jgi:hypothetical protein